MDPVEDKLLLQVSLYYDYISTITNLPAKQIFRSRQQISFARTANGGLTEKSRIPVMIKSNSTIARSSDTNIKMKTSETSCPNLTTLKRSSSSISQSVVTKNCQTLFRNNNLLPHKTLFDRQLENQCSRLREEMIKMQANSLKEHAMLSKKLEAIAREKRELSKLFTVAQKENRAAKQQLDELLQEKVEKTFSPVEILFSNLPLYVPIIIF